MRLWYLGLAMGGGAEDGWVGQPPHPDRQTGARQLVRGSADARCGAQKAERTR